MTSMQVPGLLRDPRVFAPPDDVSGAPLEGAEIGEYLSVGTDPDEITFEDAEDGGSYVGLPDETPERPEMSQSEGFYANLAVDLPPTVKTRIASELIRLIEEDKEARKKRDEEYAEGIRRTGMGNDAPGGAAFEGASKVVHPMMTEACIDYESRVFREIFPVAGPVKPYVLGEISQEKQDRADRIAEHMNWQIKNQIKEARSVLETTLTQVPLGGSQFIRQWYDHRLKRPRWEFASIDRVLVPDNSADFASADRRTYVDKISAVELKRRVDQGMYADDSLPSPSMLPEPTKAATARERVEGVDPGTMNLDGNRDLYETTVTLEVTDDMADVLGFEEAGELYPYLITIDVTSKTILAFYRCWEESDPAREALDHLYEFNFLPWAGPYGIGFPQIIGGLSAAATGAMRALLDSALANTVPGGLMLKGSGASGQTPETAIGTWTEIDSGLETDDIRKRMMPFPVNPTPPVLFQLLGFTVEAAKGVVRTSMDSTPLDGSAAVPVGTQMSRVEEGMVVFSAVFARAHASMDRLLKGLYRLNRLYMPDQIKEDIQGKQIMVSREDYLGPCAVEPTSDPSIYSDQQRFMQLTYIQGRAALFPQLYKVRELEMRGLKLMKVPDPEALLVDAPQPHELNAVNENLAMALGQPVVVFPEQDHLAHLQVLLDFLKSPVLGSNPLIAPKFLPAALQHAAQHIVYYYVQHVVETVGEAAGVDPSELMSKDNPKLKAMFDTLLATASQRVVPSLDAIMAQTIPVLQQAMQQMQAMQPKPPVDPAEAAVQAAQAETNRKGAADQAGHQIEAAKIASDAQAKQTANAIAADRVAATREGQQIAAATKLRTTNIDADTALEISETRAASGAPSHYVNGESLTKP